jgi:RecA/RadA recombinase
MAKEKGTFTIADLNSVMNKNSKFGGLLSDGHGVSKITEYISSGNYILNACMTGSLFKGIPNNRSICLSGESGVGKTYLILNICREAQKKGYFIVFYDSENAVDEDLAVNFGIDLSMFRYEPVQTVQEFRSNSTTLVDTLIAQKEEGNEIPKVLIALDSVGNLATQKEIDDAKSYSDKSDMSRAKVIKSIFRILMSKLGIIQGSFLFSNHIYQTLDLYAQTVQAGGGGIKYGASIIVNFSKAKLKEGASQTGIVVTAKPDKNRFCKPTVVKFHISYDHGMNPYVGLEEYMSWDRCGVQRGKFITKKEYDKLSETQKETCRQHPLDETVYFQPSDTGRNICTKHSVDSFKLNEIWTKKVWTDERIAELDEYIKPLFAYSKSGDEEVMDMLEDDGVSGDDGMDDEIFGK